MVLISLVNDYNKINEIKYIMYRMIFLPNSCTNLYSIFVNHCIRAINTAQALTSCAMKIYI